MRLIDADALIEYCNNQKVKTVSANDIARFPTVDAAPVKHGRWLNMRNGNADCSVCRRHMVGVYDDDNMDKFCRCCGAKMDLEEQDAKEET